MTSLPQTVFTNYRGNKQTPRDRELPILRIRHRLLGIPKGFQRIPGHGRHPWGPRDPHPIPPRGFWLFSPGKATALPKKGGRTQLPPPLPALPLHQTPPSIFRTGRTPPPPRPRPRALEVLDNSEISERGWDEEQTLEDVFTTLVNHNLQARESFQTPTSTRNIPQRCSSSGKGGYTHPQGTGSAPPSQPTTTTSGRPPCSQYAPQASPNAHHQQPLPSNPGPK